MAREDEPGGLTPWADLAGAHAPPRRFAPDELVACGKCLRANAPTRMSCLYCGAQLPPTEQGARLRRPALKKLEEWESGFNVVLLPRGLAGVPEEAVADAAALLRLDAARLEEMAAAGRALPLARASSAEEAALILERLNAHGFAAEVFTDEALAKQPVRARTLAINDDALVLFPGPDAEPHRLAWDEVALLVSGRITNRRVEVAERRTRLSSANEIVEARELYADEAVLDVYPARADAEAFRMLSDSFDYSCLGEQKGLLARENFVTLAETLRRRAAGAAFDEDYAGLRAMLSAVWPPSEHTESLGLRRERPGRFNTEAVTTVSNEAQFTRYARLRWLLTLRGRDRG